jgi:hypothetical protein
VKRILGISAVALVMGTAMAAAQSVQTPSSPNSQGAAARSGQRSGNVVTPGVNDPDTTNRNQGMGTHKDRLPGGGTTGPISPNSNGQ